MHFHRDVLAIADTFSRHVLRAATRTTSSRAVLRWASPSGSAGWWSSRCGPARAPCCSNRPAPGSCCPPSPSTGSPCCSPRRRRTARCSTSSTATTSRPCAAASRPGENLPAATWQAWHERTGLRVINGIGATELLHIFVSAADERHQARDDGRSRYRAGTRACRTRTGGRCPTGEPGLLAVRGPVGCRYLADPRQREYVRDGWNITGDTYVREPDGYFRYVARADDMIISAGYNIAGPEVEDALLRHPDVVEAAVVGRPDEARGQVVVAYAVLKEGARTGRRGAARLREERAGAVQVPARDRLPGRAAAHGDRQAPAVPAARPEGTHDRATRNDPYDLR